MAPLLVCWLLLSLVFGLLHARWVAWLKAKRDCRRPHSGPSLSAPARVFPTGVRAQAVPVKSMDRDHPHIEKDNMVNRILLARPEGVYTAAMQSMDDNGPGMGETHDLPAGKVRGHVVVKL